MGERHLKLLFVHVPKTGGTSLKLAIRHHFGEQRVLEDYGDAIGDPTALAATNPDRYLASHHGKRYGALRGKDAVLGHLWARKYEPVHFDVRATVLRDPIERAVSHYFYWLAGDRNGNPHNAVRDRRLSFMDFAQIPMINSLYTGSYFRDVDMGSFDYIGDQSTLCWDEAMRALGLDCPELHANETTDYDPRYAERASDILDNPRTMRALRPIFSDDLRFYEGSVSRQLVAA